MFKKRVRSRGGRDSASRENFFDESGVEGIPEGGGFAKTPPTAMQVGAFLRQVREQQGLTIGEVARQTRIRDVYLFALEAGEVEKLPGSTFVAGFLRLYAEILGLSDRGFIEQYLARSGHDDSLRTELFPAPTTSRHRPSVVMVLGGVIGLMSIFFVYENYFSSLSLSAQTPAVPSTAPRRAGSMPAGNVVQQTEPSELIPEEETEKGGFTSGLLSRFFDQPAAQSGAEELESLPETADSHWTPLPVGRTAPTPTAATAPTRSAKAAPVPESPAANVATKPAKPAAPTAAGSESMAPKSEGISLAFVAPLLEQAKGWFEQLGHTGSETPPPEHLDQTEPDLSLPPPVGKGRQQSERIAVVPPVQSAPVVQPMTKKETEEPKAAVVTAKAVPVAMDASESPPKPAAPAAPVKVGGTEAPAKVGGTEAPLKVGGTEAPLKPLVPAAPAKVGGTEAPVKLLVPVLPSRVEESDSPVKPLVPIGSPKLTVSEAPVKPMPSVADSKPVVAERLPSKPEPSPAVVKSPPPVIVPTAPLPQKGSDPAALILDRHPEPIRGAADLKPESEQAVSLLAHELVWVQIQDDQGRILKDMVMQPNQLFRVPAGGRFSALLGNAGAVRLRVGNKELPYLGAAGEEMSGVDLTPEALLQRSKR
ncbi:MAG: DUF4115 domain-containing protein [Magnetococcales bacterium]|nr:DUF4115 domain-containing protein [Magnetococcales bacterium]